MDMMLPLLSEIGKRRKASGMTQNVLANYAGVNRSLLAKVERGHANPSYAEAKKIFESLDMLEDTIVHGLPRITLDKVHNIDIEWAEFDEPLYLKQKSMLDNKYSQLPVRRNGQSVGSLTEKGINKVLIANKGTIHKDLLVKDVMEEGFPLVPVSATIGDVIPLLQAYQGILTIKDGKVVGIVTNADILELFQTKAVDK